MKIKFLALPSGVPDEYIISGSVVNGLDLSVFPEGGKFVGDETTREAGIHKVERDETGELIVTLAQSCTGYQVQVPSHDWRESEELIDSTELSNDVCYIIPTAMPEGCETFKTESGQWSVRKVVTNELV